MKHSVLFILVFLMASSCNDFGTGNLIVSNVLPEVRVTGMNYTNLDIAQRAPDTTLLISFSRAYAGKYSDELKSLMVDHIIRRSRVLGLNENELQACIQATGQLERGFCALPYLAERAKYNSLDAWIYEFTYGYSGGFGHYRCFVMNALTHDTLLYISCR
ncbi:MAG: hypothetical protein NTZ35_00845 [Ignavibacteriales bacterium]|nr:hypothetical protein [Ignavibacteriales bacterium]